MIWDSYQLESFSASDLYRLLTKSPEKHLCPLDKKKECECWGGEITVCFFSVWHWSWKSCHRPKPFSLPMSSWVPSCKVLILRKALYLSDLHQFCLPFASQKDQEVINPYQSLVCRWDPFMALDWLKRAWRCFCRSVARGISPVKWTPPLISTSPTSCLVFSGTGGEKEDVWTEFVAQNVPGVRQLNCKLQQSHFGIPWLCNWVFGG